jgi:glyoxylase-like metal-dependent hydrolase (beta-lactamase superfamily II)
MEIFYLYPETNKIFQIMTLKRIIAYIVISVGILLIALTILVFPFFRYFFRSEIIEPDKRLFIITGTGNSGLLVTDSAVVVIDTKFWKNAKKLHDLAKQKAGTKKILVINTHFHGDHVFGNILYRGSDIYTGGYGKDIAITRTKAENLPTFFVRDSLILDLGDEIVGLYDLGQGQTFHDMVVYLKKRKVLFTGDLVFNKINPAIIAEDGTDIKNWKSILAMMDITFDVKTVVPGHGTPGDKKMIGEQLRYFEDMEVAASHPDSSKELIKKYAGWMKIPMGSSPEKTIEFIRKTSGK